MSFLITYKSLCDISILHSYFLNNGVEEFSSMTQEDKNKMMKNYDINRFISITPTIETINKIRNNNIVFNVGKNNLKIGIKVLPDNENLTFSNTNLDLTLNFIVRIKNSLFENFTDINLSTNRIFYFSNAKPLSELTSFEYIPLNSSSALVTDNFKLSEEATKKVLNTLNPNERNQVFGIISLKMSGDNNNLNILSLNQEIIDPTPLFKIQFNNRRTFWKYIKSNRSFEVETLFEKPLTENGFVEISPTDFVDPPTDANEYKYPNPSVQSIQKISTKTYSQIFI